jgi:hypothetical protein
MNFTIDADDGRSIRGWIVLDNPATIPKLTLVIPNRPELTFDANIHRADIQEMGQHLTGHVGFDVNESLVADLAALDDVTLLESESRLMIFRRSRPQHVRKKLYIFDASVMPQSKILRELSNRFTNYHFHSERLSFETMFVIIHGHFCPSVALYGRSNFNRYAADMNNAGFVRAALLQEPYTELAERLLTLKLVASRRVTHIESITGLDRCLAFAQELKLNDERAMTQAFRRLEPDQRDLLSNPMTRLFGCDLDDPPQRRHVSVALENLATTDVVGLRSDFPLFRQMLAAAVGEDVVGEDPPVALDMVTELAQKLSRVGVVEDMLDSDRQLYDFVRTAMISAAENNQVSA